MLMANTLQFKQVSRIERVFDIKGSIVKRDVPMKLDTKKTATLKDVNFLKLTNENPRLVNFLKGDITKLNDVLRSDVFFLRSHGVMDFSLLFAIEKFVPESLNIKGECSERTSVQSIYEMLEINSDEI